MIYLSIRDRDAAAQATEPITSGSVGMRVGFSFSESWDGLAKVAVFRGSGQSIDVALTAGSCEVPHEVLQSAGGHLKIGVYGTGDEGQKVTPTVWADAGSIVEGAEPSEIEPTPATESLVQQILEAAEEARDIAQSVRDDADAGEFDGQNGAPGNSLWWTVSFIDDESMPGQVYGKIRRSWLKGRSGAPAVHDLVVGPGVGTSGSIGWLYEIISVPGIYCNLHGIGSITGAPGDPGAAGYAPEVTIETITGGHRVTITSAAHPEGQIFDVLDGQGGGTDNTAHFAFEIDDTNNNAVTPGTGVTISAIAAAASAGKVCFADVTYVDSTANTVLLLADYNSSFLTFTGGAYDNEKAVNLHGEVNNGADEWTATLEADLAHKLNKNQGIANAGKFMVVGNDGIVTPVAMAAWQGGSY
jgi:hypothetical protein